MDKSIPYGGESETRIAVSWDLSSKVVKNHKNSSWSHRIHGLGLLVTFISALRITFGVGIACLVLNNSSYVSATSASGWLILLMASIFSSVPVFGALNMILPSIPFSIAFIYTCCAVAQSYPGTNLWAILSGALVFISCLLGTWGTFPTSYSTTFFLGPFCFVVYSQGGGRLAFPSMVSAFGTPLAIIMCASIAIGYASCFLFPVTGYFLAKKKIGLAAQNLACLWHNMAKGRSQWTLKCLICEIQSDLNQYQSLVRFAQCELFFCALSGLNARFDLLSKLSDLSVELNNCNIRTPLSSNQCAEIRKMSIVLKKLIDTTDAKQMDNLRSDIVITSTTSTHDDETYSSCIVQNFTFLLSCFKHLRDGFLPVSNLHPNVREYCASIEFRQRIANWILGALAMVTASIFALVPAISSSFYDSLWPIIAVGALWTYDGSPSILKTLDRIMGVIIGGFSYYSIVAVAHIPLTNMAMLQGVLVSMVFLFSMLFGHRPGLRSGCILVIVLAMYEVPMSSNPNVPGVADWVFSRLLLNLIGGLIVLFFQSIFWVLFHPFRMFSLHFVRQIDDVDAFLREALDYGALCKRAQESHRDGMRKALSNVQELPGWFLIPMPMAEITKAADALDDLLRCLNIQQLVATPLISSDVELCLTYLQYCRYTIVSDVKLLEISFPNSSLHRTTPLTAACERLLRSLLDAAAVYDTKRRSAKLRKSTIFGSNITVLETDQ